jgi:hypothetical protein
LSDDRAIAVYGSEFQVYSSIADYRVANNDDSTWREIRSVEEKREFYKNAAADLKTLNDSLAVSSSVASRTTEPSRIAQNGDKKAPAEWTEALGVLNAGARPDLL